MINAKIVLDSVAPHGVRLTTFQVEYPKFIHGEVMTHRVFSRNASSSRAVPVKTMLERIRKQPAMPEKWGSNKPGMQAGADVLETAQARALWLKGCEAACAVAEEMLALNLHKQIINRVTEPYAHIQTIITATEWRGFFELRDHPAADPTMEALAKAMKAAYEASEAQVLTPGQWHLPYVKAEEAAGLGQAACCKLSTARCARVSYLNHDGTEPNPTKDLDLYFMLVGASPIHASPTEHQATPMLSADRWSGNFRGWDQFRKRVEQGAA